MKREDLRVQKTKRAIRTALLSLLREKAFDNITVRDITQRAVIGKGTFYYHYRDKYDLVEQLIREDILSWSRYLWSVYLNREESGAADCPQTALENLYLYRDIRAAGFNVDRLIRDRLRELSGILVLSIPGMEETEQTARLFAAMVYELFFEGKKCRPGEEKQMLETAVRDLYHLAGNLSQTRPNF